MVPLDGRRQAAERLDEAVQRAADGLATTVALVGEIGMGRSTLMEALRASTADDVTVLATVGRAADSDIGFAGLLSLLRPVEGRLEELAGDLEPDLRAALSLSQASTDAVRVRLALFRLLTTLAADEPVLIVVDDAHLLDSATWDALAFAIGRLDADRIAVVLSIDPTSTLADSLAIETIVLDPLDDSDLASVIEANASLAPEVQATCVAFGAGNPLVTLEIVRSLTPAQRAGTEPMPPIPEPPAALARGFEAALRAVPSHLWPALVVIAVDITGDASVIRRTFDDLDLPASALDELEETGFIHIDDNAVQFGHPLLAPFVLQQSTAKSRRAANHALAEILDPVRHRAARAWHLAAADGVDEEAAAGLTDVADDARRRGGTASAGRTYERAAAITPDLDDRAVRLSFALRCWLLVGDIVSVRRVAAELDRLGHGTALSDAAVAVGRRWSEGEEAVIAVLATANERTTDHRHRQELGALLADSLAAAGRIEEARRVSADLRTRAAGEAREMGVVLGEMMGDLAGGEIGETVLDEIDDRPLLSARLRLRRAEALTRHGHCAQALALLGPIDRAATSWDPAEDIALRSRNLAMQGDVGQAFELLNRRLDQLPLGADLPRAVLAVALGEIELLMGRFDSAREHVQEALPLLETAGFAPHVLRGRRTDARLALATGEPDHAVSTLSIVVQRSPRLLGVELLAALFALQRDDEARALFATVPDAPKNAPLPAIRHLTLSAMTDGNDDLFVEASRIARAAGLLLEEAEVQMLRAETAHRKGSSDVAVAAAAEVDTRLTELGVGGWRRRVQTLIDAPRNEARTLVADQLTAAEHRVAVTVAAGRTNKEAAAELFLSQKTVDYHLQNIYRKLGLRSRTELAVLLSQGD